MVGLKEHMKKDLYIQGRESACFSLNLSRRIQAINAKRMGLDQYYKEDFLIKHLKNSKKCLKNHSPMRRRTVSVFSKNENSKKAMNGSKSETLDKSKTTILFNSPSLHKDK